MFIRFFFWFSEITSDGIKKWAKITDLNFEGKLMSTNEGKQVKVVEPGVHSYFVLVSFVELEYVCKRFKIIYFLSTD